MYTYTCTDLSDKKPGAYQFKATLHMVALMGSRSYHRKRSFLLSQLMYSPFHYAGLKLVHTLKISFKSLKCSYQLHSYKLILNTHLAPLINN